MQSILCHHRFAVGQNPIHQQCARYRVGKDDRA